METKIIQTNEEFKQLQAQWDILQANSQYSTYYSGFSFQYNWWRMNTNVNKNSLFIVAVYQGSDLIGLAPLMTEKQSHFFVPFKTLKFIGRADFHDFIIDRSTKVASVIRKIFDTINAHCKYDKLELSHVAAKSPLSNFLLKSDTYNSSFQFLGENPIINFSKHDSFQAYKKTFFKKNINYYRNKLKKDYEPSLEVVYNNDNNILEQISKVHKSRNKDTKARYSLFNNSQMHQFVESLYQHPDDKTITFVLRDKNNAIISYATAYLYEGIVHNWNTSFDLKYRDYRTGDLIYLEMINYLFDHKPDFKMLDFGAGRYPWKFRMTNDFIATHKLNYNVPSSKKRYVLNTYDKLFKIGKIVLNKL